MKTKFLVFFIGICLFASFNFAQAQGVELPDPGLTPDSPFYFLERIVEGIGTFFTFGDLKKAERHTALAAERLAEAQAMAEKGKSGLVEKTLKRYEMQLQNSIARAEKAQAKGKNTEKVMEVVAMVGKATSKHPEVLAEVYEKVPEDAKPAIENAMKVSIKGHEKAVEVLKEKNVLGDVPEQAPLPENVPQEVRERIQIRVQQELEIEKVLGGIDTSKSLRDICAEKGGTPEMCEEFPLEKFESFEQIEAFCIEKGGPPELCATLEAKCREFGVTTANECFLLLSVASISTYQTAEPKFYPQQERDTDCPLGHVTYGQTKYCCEDSDRSSSLSQRHYYMKGTVECKVINTADGTLISHETNTDSCDGDRLTEWMCDDRYQASSEEYDCPQGCENGACKGLKEVMEKLEGGEVMKKLEGGEQEHIIISYQSAYIGVLFSHINDDMQAGRNLPVNYGALIISVVPDTPAARAGLQKNDIILEFNNEIITQDNGLTKMLSRSKAGETVSLKVLRGKDMLIINVGLIASPTD